MRLVQSHVGIPEQLASDVGFRHDVRIIKCHEQSRMSECPECHIQACQAGQYLRAGSSRTNQVYRYRMLRVNQVVVDIMYSFHFSMSLSFRFLNGFNSSRSKGLSFAAFVTSTRLDLVGFPPLPRCENSVSQNFFSQYSSRFA